MNEENTFDNQDPILDSSGFPEVTDSVPDFGSNLETQDPEVDAFRSNFHDNYFDVINGQSAEIEPANESVGGSTGEDLDMRLIA